MSFNLIDTLSVGVDRIERNFEPMRRKVESWRQTHFTDEQAKPILYAAFVEGKLEAPKTLLLDIHRFYFEPQHPDFAARTMWSLSNAFTSAFKKLDRFPNSRQQPSLETFSALCRLIRPSLFLLLASRNRALYDCALEKVEPMLSLGDSS